jgi:hypothetical protein
MNCTNFQFENIFLYHHGTPHLSVVVQKDFVEPKTS